MKTVRAKIVKFGVSLFILLCVWLQLQTNFRLKYTGDFYPIKRINYYLRWGAWLSGLNTYWRMFAPADRYNWKFMIYGKLLDDTEVLLPLASQQDRDFWQRNFTDFREAKHHLNLYPEQDGRRAYALHLCSIYGGPNGAILKSIVFRLENLDILSPQAAIEQGRFNALQGDKRIWDEFPCVSEP